MSVHISGQIANWPTKERMAAILSAAELRIVVGRFSIRVEDCSHFVFQELGSDLGDPSIDADADTVEDMLRDARLVSNALAKAGITHRFEIYDGLGTLCGCVHHEGTTQEDKRVSHS